LKERSIMVFEDAMIRSRGRSKNISVSPAMAVLIASITQLH